MWRWHPDIPPRHQVQSHSGVAPAPAPCDCVCGERCGHDQSRSKVAPGTSQTHSPRLRLSPSPAHCALWSAGSLLKPDPIAVLSICGTLDSRLARNNRQIVFKSNLNFLLTKNIDFNSFSHWNTFFLGQTPLFKCLRILTKHILCSVVWGTHPTQF